MDAKCASAIRAAAAGRNISQAKLDMIETALSSKMREMAKTEENWQSLSRDQRYAAASEATMKDIQAQSARAEWLGVQQILKTAETGERIVGMKVSGMKITQSQALIRDMQNSENYKNAVHDEAISGLTSLLDAASDADGTGLLRNLGMKLFQLDNPQTTADIVDEIFKGADGHTGNRVAQAGSKAYLKVIEDGRIRTNAAGGDIGKLGYGFLTQQRDATKLVAAGAKKWAMDELPRLDRKQYLREDGSAMNDAEVLQIMESAHLTLVENGLNKIEPGQYMGPGKTANAGSAHRVIHYKDGPAWRESMAQYGEGSLYDAVMGHISHMTRNIGMMERYGPNPEMQFRLQADIAQRADGVGTSANRSALNTPQAYWDILSGKSGTPENQTLGNFGQDVRNLQVASKLGGAVISSISDIGTVGASLHYNRLPFFQMIQNFKRNMEPAQKEFLIGQGIIGDHVIAAINRYTGETLNNRLAGRVAAGVMKVSLLNKWTYALRSAFAATMMQGFAKKTGTAWKDLDQWDQQLMSRKGITEADWNIISQAKPTERAGLNYLTRDSILATGADGSQQAATKWMAFVTDETQFASIAPDLSSRAITTWGGTQAGTALGETARTAMLFKSFPTAMMTRHWARVFDTPQGLEGAPAGFGATTVAGGRVNKAAVLAALNVSLMMLGATALQIKSILSGKDPEDMTEGTFWVRSLAQGGGSGYVGDVLFKDPTAFAGSSAQRNVGAVMGPAFGAAAGLGGDLIAGNIWQAAKGDETNFGAEALRLASDNLAPDVWQIRGMYEHWFLHNAQEALNPGYLNRMEQRSIKSTGQEYYWRPGEALPERAPDFEKAMGE